MPITLTVLLITSYIARNWSRLNCFKFGWIKTSKFCLLYLNYCHEHTFDEQVIILIYTIVHWSRLTNNLFPLYLVYVFINTSLQRYVQTSVFLLSSNRYLLKTEHELWTWFSICLFINLSKTTPLSLGLVLLDTSLISHSKFS